MIYDSSYLEKNEDFGCMRAESTKYPLGARALDTQILNLDLVFPPLLQLRHYSRTYVRNCCPSIMSLCYFCIDFWHAALPNNLGGCSDHSMRYFAILWFVCHAMADDSIDTWSIAVFIHFCVSRFYPISRFWAP